MISLVSYFSKLHRDKHDALSLSFFLSLSLSLCSDPPYFPLVGDVIVKWSNDQGSLESGSMFSLVTKGGVTELVAKDPKDQI